MYRDVPKSGWQGLRQSTDQKLYLMVAQDPIEVQAAKCALQDLGTLATKPDNGWTVECRAAQRAVVSAAMQLIMDLSDPGWTELPEDHTTPGPPLEWMTNLQAMPGRNPNPTSDY